MQYRPLGRSDLKVPVVSFGAWAIGGWLWGGTDDANAIRAIQRGIDLGITLIDTAAVYGMGHSETIVGRAIAGRREEVIVATKCGLRWDGERRSRGFDTVMNDGTPVRVSHDLRPESIRYECEQSLRRLRVDTIDLYQCHWPDPDTPIAETMGALADLQRAGKIRHIGVSNFSPDEMRESLKHAQVVSNQPPYNPLRREIEGDVLPFCREHRLGILAYSPLAQGLMTGAMSPDREFPEGDLRRNHPWFSRDSRQCICDMLAQMQPIADGHGATLAQVCLAWVVAQPGITTALAGARSDRQVEENAGAGSLVLSGTEIAFIRRLVEALELPGAAHAVKRS